MNLQNTIEQFLSNLKLINASKEGDTDKNYDLYFAGSEMDFSKYGEIKYQCIHNSNGNKTVFKTPEDFLESKKLRINIKPKGEQP